MKYCPRCGAEYIDEALVCADCNKKLIGAEEWNAMLGQHEEEAQELFIKLCTAADQFEADIIRDMLEKEGIPVLLRLYADTSFDGIFVPQKGWAAILVPRSRFVQAERIMLEYQKQQQG